MYRRNFTCFQVKYLCCLFLFLFAVNDMAAQIPVKLYSRPGLSLLTGKVTDVNDLPLAGVSVLIKKSSHGVITDTASKYAIHVPDPKATLVFSFVGYVKQEAVVNSRTTIVYILHA